MHPLEKRIQLYVPRKLFFPGECCMSSVSLVLGCLFLLAGVAYLAYLMGVPETYAMGSVLLLLGLGAVTSAQSARRGRI